MMSLHKQLVKDSEDYLKLVNSKEYLDLQAKFDKKYLELRNELNILSIIQYELNTNKSLFIKKDESAQCKQQKIREVKKIDKDIANMNVEIDRFNHSANMDFNF